MVDFMAGINTAGFLIAMLFFFKFWRRSGDLLFLAFWVGFLLLAIGQSLLVLTDTAPAQQAYLFIPRIVAFALITAAILYKNYRASR